MLRGVNKQILEVKNTESEYFERVIFFVKPEYANMDGDKLVKEAEKYSSLSGKPPKAKKKKKALSKKFIKISLALLLATALVIVFFNLIT